MGIKKIMVDIKILKAWIKKEGLTCTDFASRINVTETQARRVLSGSESLGSKTLGGIVKLNIPNVLFLATYGETCGEIIYKEPITISIGKGFMVKEK